MANSHRNEVFIVLRDAKKVLTADEIWELWEARFLERWQKLNNDAGPKRHTFMNWLGAAYRDGLIWRIGRGVYQARPLEQARHVQYETI